MGHLRGALPVVLDLAGRLVVALGGGPVTGGRVRAFLDEGAAVRVVAPWVCEEVAELLEAHPDRTTWVSVNVGDKKTPDIVKVRASQLRKPS